MIIIAISSFLEELNSFVCFNMVLLIILCPFANIHFWMHFFFFPIYQGDDNRMKDVHSEASRAIQGFKYLKTTQKLLDEIVGI
jgi:hypothetical protein